MLTTLLTSFFCGCAFVAGALISSALWALSSSKARNEFNDELRRYWEESTINQARQIEVWKRLADSVAELTSKDR